MPTQLGVDHPNSVKAVSRLTALTSVLLLLLIVAELATVLLKPRTVLTVHDTVGLILVPVAALKLGTTTWRMVGYYLGRGAWRLISPPRLFLRLLGPVIGVLTIALLATGVVLVVGPDSVHGAASIVHKASFYLWLLAVILHVGPHLKEAFREAARDLVKPLRGSLPGARSRLAALLAAVVVGCVLALALGGTANGYLHRYHSDKVGESSGR